MANLNSIENPVWSISTVGYGIIVEGIAAIRQRMNLAIRTSKGTDPLRPEFGSRVYKFIDSPAPVAIPNIKKELLEALEMWVPDVKVVAIKHFIKGPGNPVFELLYRVINETVVDKLIYDLEAGTVASDKVNEITLTASFPANPEKYRYQVQLLINGKQQFPAPNPAGFGTLQELFQWVQTNWFFVGKWFMLSDKIVCYMDGTNVTTASLSVSVLPIVKYEASFPELPPGKFYNVAFVANGIEATPQMPQTFSNPGEVLMWANGNWKQYGNWFIEYFLDSGNSIFSDEFADEFEVMATGYKLVGISNEKDFAGRVTITIAQ